MPLQDLCLNKIVDEFERFNLAFSTCKDENLMRNLDFLQRIYSSKIVSMLSDSYSLKEEYINFVINKYLKELDTECFDECSWEKISAKLADIGPSLEKIYFDEASKKSSWHLIFCHLPNIKIMIFPSNCSDIYLEYIALYCHNIEVLNINGSTAVSDVGINYLCIGDNGKPPCPFLKILRMEGTLVRDKSVKKLIQNVHSLEEIYYQRLPDLLFSLHKNQLEEFDKIQPYNITKLNLKHLAYEPLFTDIVKVCVSVCPQLKSFTCRVSKKEHLDLCFQLSNLEKLHLECSEDSLEINDFLKLKGTKLTSLMLCNFIISISCLAQNCPRLHKLQLNKVSFQPYDNKSIPLFLNLKKLLVGNIELADPLVIKLICKLLESSPSLEDMRFLRCISLPSEIKTQILKCCEGCSLQQVHFKHSVIEKEFVRQILLTCSSLTLLNVFGSGLEKKFCEDLFHIACSLPNNPEIIFPCDGSLESNYDDEYYEDYFVTDDEDNFIPTILDSDDDDYDPYF